MDERLLNAQWFNMQLYVGVTDSFIIMNRSSGIEIEIVSFRRN